jgi:hypothetical protein
MLYSHAVFVQSSREDGVTLVKGFLPPLMTSYSLTTARTNGCFSTLQLLCTTVEQVQQHVGCGTHARLQLFLSSASMLFPLRSRLEFHVNMML